MKSSSSLFPVAVAAVLILMAVAIEPRRAFAADDEPSREQLNKWGDEAGSTACFKLCAKH